MFDKYSVKIFFKYLFILLATISTLFLFKMYNINSMIIISVWITLLYIFSDTMIPTISIQIK